MHAKQKATPTRRSLLLIAITLPAMLSLASCSSGSSSSTTTTSTAYATAYKSLIWGSGATVTFPTSCTMTVTSTGVPPYHDPYYLAPSSITYPTVVATTPSGLQLAVTPYTASSISSSTDTINICPTKASSSTSTRAILLWV